MARPELSQVTFEIDGREVTAPEGAMLVEAAKQGDVEIPYFCYERKLGPPVGACRMCLVEIEGIPKLQTSCSTPVKDGMVVITTSDRVKEAQAAMVEFLLVNHPLDCPVCDKGGECPLQDISYGWGSGKSRFIEPKRHFRKPLELSPLVAIDRERCILCYRCVRFSQEIAEDYQLVFLERGDYTYVGTHDGRPYVGPFSGNIIELCPVGALTSTAYRFRARPWDIEGAGSLCTLCPSQCNVDFTIRDDSKVLRVLARENSEVDDGWLCDKGRFGYQTFHSPERLTAPMVREDGTLRECSWERALSEAASALGQAGARAAALAGGATTNEEGFLLQRLMREGLGSPHLDSRAGGGLDSRQARVLARPDLSARVGDIDHAGAVLVVETEPVDEAPILDLRVRKAARRNGARVVTLTSRPSTLDPNATATVRFTPGAAEAALAALAAELGSPRASGGPPGESEPPGGDAPEGGLTALAKEAVEAVAEKVGVQPFGPGAPAGGLDVSALADRAGADREAIRGAGEALRDAGDVVVLWGERVSHGARGTHAIDALLAVAEALGVAGREESGLVEICSGTNSRGLREVGVLPGIGPGLEDSPEEGMGAAEIARALDGGDISTLLLLHVDPLENHPEQAAWEQALLGATDVITFTDFLTPAIEEHATVVFPAETNAEKEGTMTHPDGRLQRVRQAVGHAGEVRPAWSVLAELSSRIGAALEPPTSATVTARLTDAVGFYNGITLQEIGGRGVRWQDRDAAANLPAAEVPSAPLDAPPELPEGLTLGTAPTLWSGAVTRHAPSLRFLAPVQRAELSPSDAERLGVTSGDEVEVSAGGRRVRAAVALRQAVRPGSVFLVSGTAADNATTLMNGAPRAVEVTKV
ncbi:MAG: NADH-quinone oxidoreductase subunit NuoG [Thermoleophilaceae bacterium]